MRPGGFYQQLPSPLQQSCCSLFAHTIPALVPHQLIITGEILFSPNKHRTRTYLPAEKPGAGAERLFRLPSPHATVPSPPSYSLCCSRSISGIYSPKHRLRFRLLVAAFPQGLRLSQRKHSLPRAGEPTGTTAPTLHAFTLFFFLPVHNGDVPPAQLLN